jgi:hypothetical protein
LPDENLLDSSFISLKETRGSSLLLPEVLKQLVFLENLVRPDTHRAEQVFLIGLEKGCARRLVLQNQRVFLDCTSGSEIFFSEKATPFWLEVLSKDGVFITVELHVEFISDNGEVLYSEVKEVQLQEKKNIESSDRDNGELFQMMTYLNSCKIFDADLLFELYGGESFKDVKGLHRMHIDGQNLPMYIKPGELLVWKEGALVKGVSQTKEFPIALVKSIDLQKCEIVLWDQEGLYCKTVAIPLTKSSTPAFRPAESFLKLHQRTDNSVTLQFLKRNIIFRKGDWILCSKDRFRNLRTFAELKECLGYAIKGELFIFDGMVKKEGLTFFTGSLFNEERTLVKKIEIALSESKKIGPVKKKELVVPAQGKNE